MAFVTAFSLLAVPASATEEYSSTGNIWTAYMEWWGSTWLADFIVGTVCSDACALSDDSLHHGSVTSYTQNSDGSFNALCKYCSNTFKVYDADLEQAYGSYVEGVEEEYGTDSFGSNGLPVYYPTLMMYGDLCTYLSGSISSSSSGCFQYKGYPIGSSNKITYGVKSTELSFPIGTYRFVVDHCKDKIADSIHWYVKPYIVDSNTDNFLMDSRSSGIFGADYNQNQSYKDFSVSSISNGILYVGLQLAGTDPTVEIDYTLRCHIECLSLGAESGNMSIESDSRPVSITGNYGIIGDDGSLTKIDATTIVNEGSSTYYNPVTNTSYDLSGWTYDYSTRTYNLTTVDDNSVTVTYGDENVTINEGDTTYNVYYLVESPSTGDDGSGSGDSGTGEDHTHD